MLHTLVLLLVLPLLCTLLYVLWTFLALLWRQARSPLRHLQGPPSPSFFLGNLREMHDQENSRLFARWEARHGSTFVYHGFVGGARLMTTDPLAIAHILGRGYEFPKPEFVRDALASMAAGHEGLLVVEGEDHRRQVRALLCTAISKRLTGYTASIRCTEEDTGECSSLRNRRESFESHPQYNQWIRTFLPVLVD